MQTLTKKEIRKITQQVVLFCAFCTFIINCFVVIVLKASNSLPPLLTNENLMWAASTCALTFICIALLLSRLESVRAYALRVEITYVQKTLGRKKFSDDTPAQVQEYDEVRRGYLKRLRNTLQNYYLLEKRN